MTTELVMTITDELIQELEQECEIRVEIVIGRRLMAALLSERAELKRDAERLAWVLEQECVVAAMNGTNSPMVYRVVWPYDGEFQSEWYPSEREAIDKAMQERQE